MPVDEQHTHTLQIAADTEVLCAPDEWDHVDLADPGWSAAETATRILGRLVYDLIATDLEYVNATVDGTPVTVGYSQEHSRFWAAEGHDVLAHASGHADDPATVWEPAAATTGRPL